MRDPAPILSPLFVTNYFNFSVIYKILPKLYKNFYINKNTETLQNHKTLKASSGEGLIEFCQKQSLLILLFIV